MPRLPGVRHQQAVRALERAGAYTMAGIVRDAGLTIDEFRAFL